MDLIEKFQQFVGFETNVFKYLHNTPKREIAEIIMKEGFRFEKYLENSTDMITGSDIVVLRYFRYQRASYGNFTIVIHIGKNLCEHYAKRLEGTMFHFTEALSKLTEYDEEESDIIYTLPEYFIKGYFNQITGEAVPNPRFTPNYDSPMFDENVKRLIRLEQKFLDDM